MKSPQKRMPGKKKKQPQRQLDMSKDDSFIISGSSDNTVTLDLPDYGAAQGVYTIDTSDTITLGNLDWDSMNPTLTTGGNTLTWSDNTYTTNYGIGPSNPSVNISHEGVNIKESGDLKIGDRSMKDFMDKVEDQLAILRPAPELEEKWDRLKELRRQYEECKQDILEKEKIMKILKEQ
jgi:hypothetical protein